MNNKLVILTSLLIFSCTKENQINTTVLNETNAIENPCQFNGDFGKAIGYDDGHLVILSKSCITFYKVLNQTYLLSQVIDFSGGDKISLSKNNLIASSTYSGESSLFQFNGSEWKMAKRITNTISPGPFSGSKYQEENAIKLFDNTFMLGDRFADIGTFGKEEGVVYVFEFNGSNWLNTQFLSASDKNAGNEFGTSIFIKDNEALIGSPKNDNGGSDRGSAYLFKKTSSTWSEKSMFFNSDGKGNDLFGSSVLITDNYFFIGAPGHENGKVYIYDKKTFKEIKSITCSNCLMFGKSFEYYQNKLYIGSDGIIFKDDSGGVYVFDVSNTNFNLEKILRPSKSYDTFYNNYGNNITNTPDLTFVTFQFYSKCFVF